MPSPSPIWRSSVCLTHGSSHVPHPQRGDEQDGCHLHRRPLPTARCAAELGEEREQDFAKEDAQGEDPHKIGVSVLQLDADGEKRDPAASRPVEEDPHEEDHEREPERHDDPRQPNVPLGPRLLPVLDLLRCVREGRGSQPDESTGDDEEQADTDVGVLEVSSRLC